MRPAAGGSLFDGSDISGMDMKERLTRKGIHWLPENPAEEALLADRPLWENFVFGRQRETAFEVGGIIKKEGGCA